MEVTEQFKRQDPRHAENHLNRFLQAKATKASSMPPHATAQRRVAAAEGARPAARPHAGLWAEVGQASESKRSATIHSQLIVMATASRGVKPHTGQPQGVIRESPHAPGSTVAQHRRRSPLPRDNPAVQAPTIGTSGTQRRRRSNQETPRYRIGTEETPVAPKA